MKEWLESQLRKIQESIQYLKVRTDTQGGHQLDALASRVDVLGTSLSRRIDETHQLFLSRNTRVDALIRALTEQQNTVVEDLAAQARDRKLREDLVHRITRIEDRILAEAE